MKFAFFSFEISCVLAVVGCRYEICRVLLHTFRMRYPHKICIVIQGGSLGGLGWWSDVRLYSDQGSFFRHLFLRVDCECNRPSFLATVFYQATAFNGDLNKWDVAKVTNMRSSESVLLLENDLT